MHLRSRSETDRKLGKISTLTSEAPEKVTSGEEDVGNDLGPSDVVSIGWN